MPDLIEVAVTCPDARVAEDIAAAAVAARLAACGNVLPGVRSVFRWEGAVETGTEALLLLKTTEAGRDALVALVAERHPYDLPVIHWRRDTATGDVAAWLAGETAAD